MDCSLNHKLSSALQELEYAIDTSVMHKAPSGFTLTKSDRILKKWKYRPRQVTRNQCLPGNRHFLYENVVSRLRQECPGFNLHSYEELMDRCSRIEAGTHEQLLDWDAEWLNPLRLSSKGWDFNGIKKGILVCKCDSCKHTLSLDLSSGSSLNKRYWERYVSSEHARHCPWRKTEFDLVNEYHLQSWNLLRDLERLRLSARGHEATKCTPEDKLQALFQCEKEPLQLFLQGFSYIRDDIVQCTGCFSRAFKNTILQTGANEHRSWCKYYDLEKLPRMIEDALDRPVDEDVTTRLKNLEQYFECM